MFKLLKSEDKIVLDNANFAKNAILYKDMLCFYEAYSQIQENQDKLPNFCYIKNNVLCLEGVCLLMKMYATEFKFETLKLTLDYLKVLYFAIASYAENDEVDREIIIKEFDEYRLASYQYSNSQSEELETKQKNVDKINAEIDGDIKKSKSSKMWGKTTKIMSISLLVLSILSIVFPILVLNYKMGNNVILWISIVFPILGFALTIALKIVSKKLFNKSSDLDFHIQNVRKKHEEEFNELAELQNKYYKVLCEKYEYKTCFSEVLSKYTTVLTIDEILEKAKDYKMLSYNLAYDISRLFKSQQKEITEIIEDIDNIKVSTNYREEFQSIYKKICEQDWLYYNLELRLHFLKKFTEIGEKENEWVIDIDNQDVNPFGLKIRDLVKEMIAFSCDTNKKMISAPLSEFLKTKYFKNSEEFNFKKGYSIDELKKIKANYLKHFFRHDVMKNLANVFFDEKGKDTKLKTEFPVEELEKVPTLICLKLKVIENLIGIGNSDANVIKSIAQSLFDDMIHREVVEIPPLTENDIEYPRFTSDSIEEFDDCIIYNIGSEKKVGYKLN